MRYLCFLLLALLLGSAPLLSSCRVITPDTVHTEKESEREQRIETLLEEYDRKIKELGTKVDAAGRTVNEDLRQSLQDLKRTHAEAVRKLEDLRNAPNTKWKQVNADLQITLEEMKQAYDRTREKGR